MMKYLSLVPFLLFCLGCASKKQVSNTNEIEVTKIWDKAPHNAFTDLVRFKNAFYCTFREGPDHVSGPNGSARVLRSADGIKWESVAAFQLDDFDIRDPKLSITPDGRIMVLMDVESYENGKVASRKPYVSYSDRSGNQFSAPAMSEIEPSAASWSDWVWRVTWHKGTGYAINYRPHGIDLLRTKDGGSFEKVSTLEVDGFPNESTIRFDKEGKMYVLIRREREDKMGVLAVSEAPYQQWKFNKLDQQLGGPNFLFLNDSTLLIGSRMYPKAAPDNKPGQMRRTAIFLSDLQGKIYQTITLPSGGDTSYPGMAIFKDKLWLSYYSSHEGKSSIYLAKIPLSKLTR